MGTCTTTIKYVTFDFTDEQLTKVIVQIDFDGDCPIQIKRRHEKSFPARFSVVEIMTMEEGVKDCLLW
jgi:hypothetical protein